MEKYNIDFKRSALKSIRSLPRKDVQLLLQRIETLSDDPRPYNCKKLSGEDSYRIRVGDYRILYQVKDKILLVLVIAVGHRKDVYR